MSFDTNAAVQSPATLNRRQLVAGGAALGAAALASRSLAVASAEEAAGEPAGAVDAVVADQPAEETISCDLVVVGAGMAGLATAAYAMQQGCENVVVLEKNPEVGGSTALSESIFANGSAYQQEQGYEPYEVNEMLSEEVAWSHSIIDESLFRAYLESAPEYTAWLLELGVKFGGMVDAGTGRYTAAIYEGGGIEAALSMKQACLDLGVDLRLETPAVGLITSGAAVSGVKAVVDGHRVDFTAPTVCLACGGVCTDPERMDVYTRLNAGTWTSVGAATGQDGDWIPWVEATPHGRVKHVTPQNMWLLVEGAGLLDPVQSIMGMESSNIWINQKAQRFVNEGLAQQFYTATNVMQNQGAAFSLMDQAHVQKFVDEGGSVFWSMWSRFMDPITDAQELLDASVADEGVALYQADSLEALAELAGLDPTALVETVTAWNAGVEAGADSQFGKDPVLMTTISEPPFYLAKLTNGVLNTMGGIRIDGDARVVTPDGTPIDGLYAAGITASGFAGEVYGFAAPGSNQGPAVYLGRIVGQTAADRR